MHIQVYQCKKIDTDLTCILRRKKGNGLRQKKEQSQAKRLYEIKSSAHEIAVERYIAAAAASIKCIEYDRIENTI